MKPLIFLPYLQQRKKKQQQLFTGCLSKAFSQRGIYNDKCAISAKCKNHHSNLPFRVPICSRGSQAFRMSGIKVTAKGDEYI